MEEKTGETYFASWKRRQTRDPLEAIQGIEFSWTLKALAFSSRYLFQKYPRIQTTPFTKGQVKKPRYQVPITVTVIFIFIFILKFEGMANVPFSASAPPLRNGPHVTVEPPLTVTSPQLNCDQSLYFFRFSEGKTRARGRASKTPSVTRKENRKDCSYPTPQRPPLCNGHFFSPGRKIIHTMTLV